MVPVKSTTAHLWARIYIQFPKNLNKIKNTLYAEG